MTTIQIAGVPEHFNLPWHLAIENKEFANEGIDLQWTDVPEGTGKMCQMLRDGTADIAIILTEGIIKDIIAGNPSKIVQVYVESPLIWGIHVAAQSKYETLAQLEDTKAAISRIGSGSQLMAYVNAKNQNWDLNSLSFEIINTIDGAVTALTEGTADYFMWEKFMTQPLIDNGVFKRVGECPTPWPCFVIAVRESLLENNPTIVKKIVEIINSKTLHFKETKGIIQILAKRYQQKENDLQNWLEITEWSQKTITQEEYDKIQNSLFELGIINKKSTFASIVKRL